MSIVDALVENPGLYIGVDRVQGTDLVGATRMVVRALPGKIGVALDYEILNADTPGPILGHVEHTLIARAHGGQTILVLADTHAGALVTLVEGEPGVFEPGPGGSPYPMKVIVDVPKPGRLTYHWWYAAPGGTAESRDLAEFELAT
jgi:hypothetical protein